MRDLVSCSAGETPAPRSLHNFRFFFTGPDAACFSSFARSSARLRSALSSTVSSRPCSSSSTTWAPDPSSPGAGDTRACPDGWDDDDPPPALCRPSAPKRPILGLDGPPPPPGDCELLAAPPVFLSPAPSRPMPPFFLDVVGEGERESAGDGDRDGAGEGEGEGEGEGDAFGDSDGSRGAASPSSSTFRFGADFNFFGGGEGEGDGDAVASLSSGPVFFDKAGFDFLEEGEGEGEGEGVASSFSAGLCKPDLDCLGSGDGEGVGEAVASSLSSTFGRMAIFSLFFGCSSSVPEAEAVSEAVSEPSSSPGRTGRTGRDELPAGFPVLVDEDVPVDFAVTRRVDGRGAASGSPKGVSSVWSSSCAVTVSRLGLREGAISPPSSSTLGQHTE